jgi:hypothetical protein
MLLAAEAGSMLSNARKKRREEESDATETMGMDV